MASKMADDVSLASTSDGGTSPVIKDRVARHVDQLLTEMRREVPDDDVGIEMIAAFDAEEAQYNDAKTPEHALVFGVPTGACGDGVTEALPLDGANGVAPSAQLDGANGVAPPAQDSVEVAVMYTCTKCKLEKQIEGLAAPYNFICKPCNCKRSTCSQLFGYWPVEVFLMLPEEQQISFWRSGSRGKLQIQNALVNEVVSQREEEQRTSVGGKYLPLDVWERKGFDINKIKDDCKDTQEHAFFGTCYNVGLKKITKEDITKKVWKDLFKVGGEKDNFSPKRKKHTKKKNKKKNKKTSSSSSSLSSDSSVSSKPRVSPVEQRKIEAAQRKKAAAAIKEQERLEKVVKAAAEKAAKEADKARADEAKEKHKAAMETQNTYSRLFNAHAKLIADCHFVPMEKQASTDYEAAVGKITEGENLIVECLDTMKEKTPTPHEEVKLYLQSLRPVTSALAKLMAKKQRR